MLHKTVLLGPVLHTATSWLEGVYLRLGVSVRFQLAGLTPYLFSRCSPQTNIRRQISLGVRNVWVWHPFPDKCSAICFVKFWHVVHPEDLTSNIKKVALSEHIFDYIYAHSLI
ncbi:hypothetical protein DPEC_G00236750 [Dallia pectoralis]|uniref:Uncharacterized protein n=1 Tax=Dallia pectoralis TaxID=75939 RepID=A0ACC2FYN2_DALPE|nr:hypothetical protein DPEC_G00236750 [Dallia pectoralis]